MKALKTVRLSFGPAFAVPCSIYAGTNSDAKTARHQYTLIGDEYHSVGNQPYDKTTGNPVDRADIIKGVEVNGGVVEVTDDEIAALQVGDPLSMELITFRPISEFESGKYLPTNLYQVRPAKTGTGKNRAVHPSDEASFALIMKALRATSKFALVRFSLRSSFQYGALMSTGRLYALRFEGEVRPDLPLPELPLDQEHVELMKKFVEQNTGEHDPLTDNTAEAVNDYVAAKAKGDVLPVSTSEVVSTGATDLTASLNALLGQ